MNKQLTLIASSLVMAFSSPSLYAQDSVSQFDEIVVSGTRTEESIKNIPSSVAKITSEQMNENLATDVKQALKYEPGVSVNGQGRFGMEDITIRGMKGSRVKVLVDGVEQPTSYNPGANAMRKNSNNYEIDTLKAIEINKGPTSTLYGSDALGGTVIMRTKNPEDLLKGELSHVGLKSGYASADDQYKLGVEAAKQIGDLETMFIYTYRNGHETDAYDTHDNSKGVTRKSADPLNIESHNVLAKVFYQINNTNRIGFTGEYYTRSANGDILSRDGYSVMPGFTYTKTRGVDEDNRKRFGFEHEWLANNTVFDSLKWQVNWQQQHSQHDNYDHTDMFGNRNRYREGEDTSKQFDIQLAKAIELAQSSHKLTYGATIVNDDFDLNYIDYNLDNSTSKPGSTEVPTAKSEKRGVFIQDQIFMFNDKAVVTAGARYDEFEAKPDSNSGLQDHKSEAFTARLGAVYHWNDNFSTYAQYSQGFRAPTLYEMYYDKNNIAHGYIIKSNPNLKPEESNSYELGLRAENRIGNVTASVYYNDYSNFIQKVTTNSNNIDITTNENIDKARIYGAELSTNVWLDEITNAPMGTYAKATIAYSNGKDKQTGNTLDTIAPLTSVVGVGYDAPNEAWGTALDVKMVAAKDNWQDKNNLNVAGYTVVDLTTYYHPVKGMTVRAGLFNALDKEYWEYQDMAGASKMTDGIERRSQPGRNFGVNLNYDF